MHTHGKAHQGRHDDFVPLIRQPQPCLASRARQMGFSQIEADKILSASQTRALLPARVTAY
jgi:hypothetical protein